MDCLGFHPSYQIKMKSPNGTLRHKVVSRQGEMSYRKAEPPEKENYSIMLKGTIFGDKRDWISILHLPFIVCHLVVFEPHFPLYNVRSDSVYLIGLLGGFSNIIK